MRRWLIILSLAVAQYPGLAAASTRAPEVPFWKRLLSVFTPNTVPAARPVFRESVHREPMHRERLRSTKTAAPVNSPEPMTVPPTPASLAAASPAVTPQITAPQTTTPQAVLPQAAVPSVTTPPAVAPGSEMTVAALPAPAAVLPDAPVPVREHRTKSGCSNGGQRVVSAYYWEGRHTASGQPFNPHGMTAAHRTLPFGTHLTVTNPRNGQSVNVVINDRGPVVSGVSLDLSLGAAQAIGLHGTGSVCIF
jgi:rare lipoprotein A